MVCAVMSGAIFKTKSLTLVPALCIADREEGTGEAGGSAAGTCIRENMQRFYSGEKYFSYKYNADFPCIFYGIFADIMGE